jgi:small subunit ribosomal protein S3Ae
VLGKLSLDIYKDAKMVYPLRRVEVRKMEITGEPSIISAPSTSTPETSIIS